MIIHGREDQIVPYKGKFVSQQTAQPPINFLTTFFREKYKCDPYNLNHIYFKNNDNKINDYTRCMSQITDTQNAECKTPVVFCLAIKGGHWWWSSKIPARSLPIDLKPWVGENTQTFDINDQILKFFNRIWKKDQPKDQKEDL